MKATCPWGESYDSGTCSREILVLYKHLNRLPAMVAMSHVVAKPAEERYRSVLR